MQGEAMSPFLFSMYINDFENELIKDLCEPIYLQDISLFLLRDSWWSSENDWYFTYIQY